MQIIYKYEIHDISNPLMFRNIMMPVGKIISVQLQNEKIFAWVEFEKGAPLVLNNFIIIYTGQEFYLPNNFNYLSTIQLGGLVYHIYQNITN